VPAGELWVLPATWMLSVVVRGENQRQLKLQVLHCRSDRLLDWAAQLMSYICKLYSCCYGWWLVV